MYFLQEIVPGAQSCIVQEQSYRVQSGNDRGAVHPITSQCGIDAC